MGNKLLDLRVFLIRRQKKRYVKIKVKMSFLKHVLVILVANGVMIAAFMTIRFVLNVDMSSHLSVHFVSTGD